MLHKCISTCIIAYMYNHVYTYTAILYHSYILWFTSHYFHWMYLHPFFLGFHIRDKHDHPHGTLYEFCPLPSLSWATDLKRSLAGSICVGCFGPSCDVCGIHLRLEKMAKTRRDVCKNQKQEHAKHTRTHIFEWSLRVSTAKLHFIPTCIHHLRVGGFLGSCKFETFQFLQN